MPRPSNPTPSTDRDALAEKIASIPDKLAAVELSLKPLCNDHLAGIPVEAQSTIVEACSLLRSVKDDVLEVLRELNVWPPLPQPIPRDLNAPLDE